MSVVTGYCPACGANGWLCVDDSDRIRCSVNECPNPYAVAELLEAPDEHFVTLSPAGWVVEHSLRCRVSGEMGTCRFGTAVAAMGDPELVGRWRITDIDSEGLPTLEKA